MSLKAEFEEISKNTWGIMVLISWGVFIFFTFWNMVLAFIETGNTDVGFVGGGIISLVALGSAALYLLTVLIVKKSSLSKNQLYLLFSIIPLTLLFIMAVVTGFLQNAWLLWPYILMLVGSIGIILSTYYYIETKGKQPAKVVTETEV